MELSPVKRIVAIFGLLAATIALGYLLYAVFFRPQLPGSPATPPSKTPGLPPAGGGNVNARVVRDVNGRLPTGEATPSPRAAASPTGSPAAAIANGGLTRTNPYLTAAATQPTLDRDGSSLLYYEANSGRFYRSSESGQVTPLTERAFHAVERITWAENRQRAVLEYPDGANILYDFGSGKQTTLPKHWEAFTFSPDGNFVAGKSLGLETENRWLVVADATGSRVRTVAALGANAPSVQVNWSPGGQIVALQVETQGVDRQEIFPIGLNNERFRSMLVPGWGFEGQWTPDGRRLLYSVNSSRNQSKPELWVSDATPDAMGENRREVGLQTWAHKCAFSSASVVYCAVPKTLPAAAGLFPAEMDTEVDRLYRVELGSGATTLVAEPDTAHTMRELIVSRDGRYLYYTARQDGKIYRIQLK